MIAEIHTDVVARLANEGSIGVIFKNCAQSSDCTSVISNTQVDNTKDLNVVMPKYNLPKYSDNYSKISGILWQCYREEPDKTAMTNSESFKSDVRITETTPASGNKKNVEIAVPLKYLSNFWGTFEMLLINCRINLILTWFSDCAISVKARTTKFAIIETDIYVPVVILSTQINAKILQEMESGFEITTAWNKYQFKVTTQA